jgi:hypothetical protein
MMGPDEESDDWLHYGPPDLTHIAANLWMGACPQVEAPPQFDHIVALYVGRPPYRLFAYQTLTCAEMEDAFFMPPEQMVYRMARIVNFLRTMGPTLVHCQAGLNRSGLITALALIESGLAPKHAIALLRDKRHAQVLCNPVFEAWLVKDRSSARTD